MNSPGYDKIVKCIESSTDGNHINACINMVISYGKILKRDTPSKYLQVKIELLERIVKKSNSVLVSIREQLSKIKSQM